MRIPPGTRRYNVIKREYKDVLKNWTTEDLYKEACRIRDGLLALPKEQQPDRAHWDFIFEV